MPALAIRAMLGRGLERLWIGLRSPAPIAPRIPTPGLPAYQLHRLRMLAEKPRAYSTRDTVNPALERLGFVRATGHVDSVRGRKVWAITEAGRAFLGGQINA